LQGFVGGDGGLMRVGGHSFVTFFLILATG
jgi:hypothetical protein